MAVLKEKRKKLEEENAAKKEKERLEREEKAKMENFASDSQQPPGLRTQNIADDANAESSTLNRTIEWSTPPRSTRMEVCNSYCVK